MDFANAGQRFLPDYFFGQVPPGWWPDRPRDPRFYTLNVLPLAAGSGVAVTVVEQIFNKKKDILIFGGIAHVVDHTSQATISCPLAGVWSRIDCQMLNPAAAIVYTSDFVPLENLFGIWQRPGDKPVFWPMPLSIPKGGSLQFNLRSYCPLDQDLRLTFYAANLYDFKDRTVGE